MIRLFAGIELPYTAKSALLSRMGGVEGARWQNENQLHMTLRFFGDMDEPVAEDLVGALYGVDFDPVDIRIGGVGLFGKMHKPRLLYAGVARTGALETLFTKIDMAGQRVGLGADKRRFTPHVALSRFRNGKIGRLDDFIAANSDLSVPAFTAGFFSLFRSHLSEFGSHYEVVERFAASDAEAVKGAGHLADIGTAE